MILIADSGSTKTRWYYSEGENKSKIISTAGINPFFRTTEEIIEELLQELVPEINSGLKEIFFYGAGVVNKEKGEVIKLALQKLFVGATVDVESDLFAAARATMGIQKGIVCILGTGSNSCLYNGDKIVEHVPPLGYILGDEGSGAVLGKKLAGDYLKGLMPKRISQSFMEKYPIGYSGFLESVYKKEMPNKFLAQFVPFLHENIGDEYCRKLVELSFDEFLKRNVAQYSEFKSLKINFVGSVAYYFQEQLKTVLDRNNLQLGIIYKEPLEGLVRFHLNT